MTLDLDNYRRTTSADSNPLIALNKNEIYESPDFVTRAVSWFPSVLKEALPHTGRWHIHDTEKNWMKNTRMV